MATKIKAGQEKIEEEMGNKMHKERQQEKERAKPKKIEEETTDTRRYHRFWQSELLVPIRVARQGQCTH